MDAPEIPSNKGGSVGIALALVVSPAVLYMLQWSLVKSNELGMVILFGGPVVGGVTAGVLLSRALAHTRTARIVTGLLLCPACVVVSLIIALFGCSIVNPMRS
jgi:hypothetical protein